MRKLFGTDGIRGVAAEAPLDAQTVYAVGLALAHSLRPTSIVPRVVIGRDTRESSVWIAQMLCAGLAAGGAEVESAGVVPTPAVAFLAHTHGFHAGVVISASHNPWRDNGIKLFGGDGLKLQDKVELEIEDVIFRHAITAEAPELATLPPLADNPALADDYFDSLVQAVPGLYLTNMQICVDCANGAAYALAPRLFARLHANATLLNIEPDGRNINHDCGALHPEAVGKAVIASRAQLGITFDGDADRCLLTDSQGHTVNGDAILLMAARDMKARSLLTGNLVVATTMSNMGLEAALKRDGIQLLRANVGDRYVLELMQQQQAALGGEQSGHILFPHLSTTGDGLLTALVMLDLIARSGRTIEALVADLKVFPQTIKNVRVREKLPMAELPEVMRAIALAEVDLADSGRVVVRYSGTEKLARVMIEAEDESMMQAHAEAIASAINAAIGEKQT